MKKAIIKVEVIHVGEDYYKVLINDMEYAVSFTVGKLIIGMLKTVRKVVLEE